MGGGPSNKWNITEQISRLQMDPEIQKAYMQSVFGLQPQVETYQQQAADAASQLQTGPLSTQPSALTRGIISTGRQGMLDAYNAQLRGLSNLDPRTRQLMSGQIAARTTLAANPLTLQALENQRSRDLAERQMMNQATIQRLGLQAAPMQAQQNLIQQLGQAGQLTGLTRQAQMQSEEAISRQNTLKDYGVTPGSVTGPASRFGIGNYTPQTYKA